jgi:hypothetical protein
MSMREAMAEHVAAAGAMSWREALADVNDDEEGGGSGGDEDDERVTSGDDERVTAGAGTAAHADTAGGADAAAATAAPGPPAAPPAEATIEAATITGAQVMAALAEDGVDVVRWRARVALTMERATTKQHFNPEARRGGVRTR